MGIDRVAEDGVGDKWTWYGNYLGTSRERDEEGGYDKCWLHSCWICGAKVADWFMGFAVKSVGEWRPGAIVGNLKRKSTCTLCSVRKVHSYCRSR